MRYRLTPPQFAVVMTILWAIAVVALVPLTLVTIIFAVLVGLPASLIFFHSMAELVLMYMPLAEARFNERFPSNES